MATPSSASVSSSSGSITSSPSVTFSGGGPGSLTSLLRAISARDGPFVDYRSPEVIADLRQQRVTLLQQKRSTSATAEPGSEREFTWATFSAGISATAPGITEAKLQHTSFLLIVQEIAGDERAGSDLYQAAHVIYRAVTSKASFAKQKEQLVKYFGPIADEQLRRASAHCERLNKWKYGILGEPAPTETKKAAGGKDKDVTVEFGSELEFNDPFIDPDSDDDDEGDEKKKTKQQLEDEDENDRLEDAETDSDDDEDDVPVTVAPSDRKLVPFKKPAEEKKKDSSVVYDWEWLRKSCEKYASFTATGEPLVSESELAQQAVTILQSSKGPVEIQGQLLDLLGFEAVELVGTMVTNRPALRNITKKAMQAKPIEPTREEMDAARAQTQHLRGLVGVTVTSAVQKAREKKLKKLDRKLARRTARGLDDDGSMAIDDDLLTQQSQHLDHLRRDTGDKPAATGLTLPEGTTRVMHNKNQYEEVSIPPVMPPDYDVDELVPIKEFSEFAQMAFKGTKRLNRIQSKCFQAAYRSNHNLLVCAPTGAGKTNIAMMSVLHEVEQHIAGGVLQKDMFKIVYVAPMKALAQEVQEKFQEKLAPLGIIVKELTGDMQLTKREIKETQMIVTTPEKWDVVTRKSGDESLMSMVRLLIIDEVHLLHEERGPVIEILVARTLRMVESSQKMCRIVGLSATLPNYQDVAVFLGVNPKEGLFFFDSSYRPVPLSQYYIGVTDPNSVRRTLQMNDIAYRKTLSSLANGHQVMVFVHSRRDTVKTAQWMRALAEQEKKAEWFIPNEEEHGGALRAAAIKLGRTKNSELLDLFHGGFGVHHAGMGRPERTMMEKYFSEGLIKVLVCTSTLAWGVNLPAHTVIIKGTQLYDAKRGGFVELSMLDVMQIFGRAGRPQFDKSGEGIIITSHDKLNHYLSLLNHQMPIESQFIQALPNHLNAEIILGTVTNMAEATSWLQYTYLFTRMLRNPLVYGITYEEKDMDTFLVGKRRSLLIEAAKTLMKCRMVKFDLGSGNFFSTDVGRVASHYYIHHESVEKYNTMLKTHMEDEEILHLLSSSKEFDNIKLREEEMPELEKLSKKYCPIKVKGGLDSPTGKANVLLQTYISNGVLDASTLSSDCYYIQQSAGRITRALFEMVLKKGKTFLASRLLTFCKMIDRRIWEFQHPLRQFPALKMPIIMKLEERTDTKVEDLIELSPKEIGEIIRQNKMGDQVMTYLQQLPYLELKATVQPVTRTVLKVDLTITPQFHWNDRVHGSVEGWWIWVEDHENEHIYHHEYFLLHKQKAREPHKMTFTIPIFEPLPPQYFIKAISDRWLGCETVLEVSFKHLILPEIYPPSTDLLNLHPLPVTALFNKQAESMYKFTHYNPIQTQVFHTVYHTDENILLGAPTGSGKTAVAEMSILRLFALSPGQKAVYIAPMKALARERIEGWGAASSFAGKMGRKTVELTGDTVPDALAIKEADILITTPEKWDGVSRSWRTRGYVKQVGLVIIDEIHLLGQDRGPILEVIVSRMRYISSHTSQPVRIVGLSTALSNAKDLADWLGIEGPGFFNFPPQFRPVPLSVHISGFPGKHYCPRMASMNKPTYAAITTHSPTKPVLVFVSSRRQTRLTALDLIQFCAADGNPRKWLRLSDEELEYYQHQVRDAHLKHMLAFGIGMHHAGLAPKDRKIVEQLFVDLKIQVLVCTATLAWGVNFPAHLVVIKGTEYYDAKTSRYVDFPITDVLQMMGRAGRPQFDDEGKACVLVHEPKKNFYINFLHHPFPVESSLVPVLHDHFNAEVVGGTIGSIQDAIDYLSWTFFFRRLLVNPSFYNLEDCSPQGLNKYLLNLVTKTIKDLEEAGCCRFDEDGTVTALSPGKIASFYYLKYTTVLMFSKKLSAACELPDLLDVLSSASEYDDLPVRHNEDKLNEELADAMRWQVDKFTCDSPHTKTNILLQAWFLHMDLPISDYYTDTKSVLDQAIRILQAMVDVTAEAGWLSTALKVMNLTQMVVQARWLTDNTLVIVPHMNSKWLGLLWDASVECLPELLGMPASERKTIAVQAGLTEKQITEAEAVITQLPIIGTTFEVLIGGAEGEAKSAAKGISTFAPAADAKDPVTGKKKILTRDCPQGEKIDVVIHLDRLNRIGNAAPGKSNKAYAPAFGKPKEEGWWLIVGCPMADDLHALKRIFIRGRTTYTLSFVAPMVAGQYRYTVFLMSDSYLGLDQQYDFILRIGDYERAERERAEREAKEEAEAAAAELQAAAEAAAKAAEANAQLKDAGAVALSSESWADANDEEEDQHDGEGDDNGDDGEGDFEGDEEDAYDEEADGNGEEATM